MEIELVVFDMAGTTVRDNHEVEACFAISAKESGLEVSDERIRAVQGWSKRRVFQVLWEEKLGNDHPELASRVDRSYDHFRKVLESHYESNEVRPADNAVEVFEFLKTSGIKIALTTGFYRKVTNIILGKLGWDQGLNDEYLRDGEGIIDLSIASDEVPFGRPKPDMIHLAMQKLGVSDPSKVIKIGDTPSDLTAGKAAGCFLTLGVTNGTHTKTQLEAFPNDGLLNSLKELPGIIAEKHALVS